MNKRYYKARWVIWADTPEGGVWIVRYRVCQWLMRTVFWLAGFRNVQNSRE